VYLTITLQILMKEYIQNVDRAILKMSSRTQLGVSINVWRLARDTLNFTCNVGEAIHVAGLQRP
jgi:hypothetical protein